VPDPVEGVTAWTDTAPPSIKLSAEGREAFIQECVPVDLLYKKPQKDCTSICMFGSCLHTHLKNTQLPIRAQEEHASIKYLRYLWCTVLHLSIVAFPSAVLKCRIGELPPPPPYNF
jgi:hypothetical protein